MISPDIVFLALAGIAFLGFILDATFHRLRIASILPLMLLGLALVVSGVIPASTIALLNALIPYVSAVTVAFILFAVGLEIRFADLFRVLGRATAFTIGVQVSTGIAISLLAYATIHWSLLISFVFGFALSGPSSIAVPVLVRVARMPQQLRTSLLYESVMSDVLQLLVPILMIGLLVRGDVSGAAIASALAWTVVGSVAGGIVAAVAWLWLLGRLRSYAAGYTWTLTITMVLATYGAADRIGLSAAIVIFVFGVTLGNAALLDFRRSRESPVPIDWLSIHLHDLREWLGLSTKGLDIPHIMSVQKEVSFFASAFFFVYLGLLFQTASLSVLLVLVAIAATLVMLATRYAFIPILAPYLDREPEARRSQRGLLGFNISRGLAAAVVATIPQGVGIVIPGFLDAIFLGILASTVVSTVGIFVLYRPPAGEPEEPLPPGASLSMPTFELPGGSVGPPLDRPEVRAPSGGAHGEVDGRPSPPPAVPSPVGPPSPGADPTGAPPLRPVPPLPERRGRAKEPR